MKTLLVFMALAVIAILSQIKSRRSDNWEKALNLDTFSWVLVIILGISLMCLPISRSDYKAKLRQHEVFKTAVSEARLSNNSEIERAAIFSHVVEWNISIESARYWNSTIFDLFIPNEFTELELLK